MKTSIQERYLVSPFFVFFLVHANMVGIGILGYQRKLIQSAGYDAWISVIITGISTHLIMWMMYAMLKTGASDIIELHIRCFGRWLGKLLSLLVLVYVLVAAFIIFRSYVEVVKIIIFPLMQTWSMSILMLLLLYYVVSGGFRTVTGICLVGVTLPLLLMVPLFVFPFEYVHPNNLLPVFSHTVHELFLSAKEVIFNFAGFELLFFYYPFIKNPQQSQKWAHAALLFTTVLYLVLTMMTFMFFTEGELEKIIWPTLTMIKIIEIPIIQRIEFIIVSLWLFVVLPNLCLNVWAITRGMKQMFQTNQRRTLLAILLVLMLTSLGMESRADLMMLSNMFGTAAMYFLYGYIPFLFLVYHLWGKRRGSNALLSSTHEINEA
ncbi:GerAB/ArcD/ProY family transporter [Brevibacillus choshinensis]|uniref:GerAB/ArcD/ProY family transporter n=1 Tax=Brevibacillus choshinensis TaxID=54911 RepID=UPI002E24D433|nr:GerAB/ArcD/ProY family transporter [Brevibacillus choshinensis]MED4783020.1 GerAB/ArcD/ProY family transporter [Brevibacillus choshinensis]